MISLPHSNSYPPPRHEGPLQQIPANGRRTLALHTALSIAKSRPSIRGWLDTARRQSLRLGGTREAGLARQSQCLAGILQRLLFLSASIPWFSRSATTVFFGVVLRRGAFSNPNRSSS